MIKTINLRKLIPSILLPVFVGLLGSLFSSNSSEVYQNLQKPPLSPPGIIFPFVWSALYILIGLSWYFADEADCSNKKRLRQAYLTSLALNLLWPLFFFTWELFIIALIIIFALLIANIITNYLFYQCDKTAFYLFLPYTIWTAFATYLNIGIVALN